MSEGGGEGGREGAKWNKGKGRGEMMEKLHIYEERKHNSNK